MMLILPVIKDEFETLGLYTEYSIFYLLKQWFLSIKNVVRVKNGAVYEIVKLRASASLCNQTGRILEYPCPKRFLYLYSLSFSEKKRKCFSVYAFKASDQFLFVYSLLLC